MSSHHIVRENQEPALVILDAQVIPFEKVLELLEWMPTIIVLHTQLETVLGWGIKVDVVLVPVNEEQAWIARTQDQQPIQIIPFHTTESPLHKAIEMLSARQIPAVNVLASDKAALHAMAEFKGDAEVFFENKRWSRVKSGRFEKWVAAGTKLFVWPERVHHEISFLENGAVVAEKDGLITFVASSLFWVGEELG
ncbi:MAG: hypothetical protein J0L66_08390 [Cytophagales bacterium]|nr:hypothetical protein [Cytophagales bacterium]